MSEYVLMKNPDKVIVEVPKDKVNKYKDKGWEETLLYIDEDKELDEISNLLFTIKLTDITKENQNELFQKFDILRKRYVTLRNKLMDRGLTKTQLDTIFKDINYLFCSMSLCKF